MGWGNRIYVCYSAAATARLIAVVGPTARDPYHARLTAVVGPTARDPYHAPFTIRSRILPRVGGHTFILIMPLLLWL